AGRGGRTATEQGTLEVDLHQVEVDSTGALDPALLTPQRAGGRDQGCVVSREQVRGPAATGLEEVLVDRDPAARRPGPRLGHLPGTEVAPLTAHRDATPPERAWRRPRRGCPDSGRRNGPIPPSRVPGPL